MKATRPLYRSYALWKRGASVLHGSHHEAQKLITTTFPRSEESFSFPDPFRRLRSKSTGFARWCLSYELATVLRSLCTTFHTSRASSAATRPTAPTWPASFSRDIYADTMNTVVPMSTELNSHSASWMYIRMQPCETE